MIMPPLGKELMSKLEKLDFGAVKYLMKEMQRCFMQFQNFKGEFM